MYECIQSAATLAPLGHDCRAVRQYGGRAVMPGLKAQPSRHGAAHRELAQQLAAHALDHRHGAVAQKHGRGVLEVRPAALCSCPAIVGPRKRQVVAAAAGALCERLLRQGGRPPGMRLNRQQGAPNTSGRPCAAPRLQLQAHASQIMLQQLLHCA